MNVKLIEGQTDAIKSGAIFLEPGEKATLVLFDSVSGDVADVEIFHEDDVDYTTASKWTTVKSTDADTQLSFTNTTVLIDGPGVYRVSKGATTGVAGITVAKR